MKNTRLLGGGVSNGRSCVWIEVISTGQQYYLYGRTADRYMARYINEEDR